MEQLFFQFFHMKRQEKLKKNSVTMIVLTFHCLNNLGQDNYGNKIPKLEGRLFFKQRNPGVVEAIKILGVRANSKYIENPRMILSESNAFNPPKTECTMKL